MNGYERLGEECEDDTVMREVVYSTLRISGCTIT